MFIKKLILCILVITIFSSSALSFIVNINSPTSNSFVKGTILLNATLVTSYNVTNVTFRWNNSLNLVYNTTIYNNTLDDTMFNATFNTALLSDGNYNLSILSFNTTGDNSTNNSIVNITVDNTVPSILLINSSFSTINTTPSIYFNYTDTNLATQNCTLYLNNANYSTIQTTANATALHLNITSALSDSAYTTYVNCTDSAGNTGMSNSITATIDTTAPTITLSKFSSTSTSLTIVITTSSDATCTLSDGSLIGSGASQTVVQGSLNSDTAYTYTVTCTDAVGHSTSASGSFKTDQFAGSGLEGNAGGTTVGVPNQFQKKFWYTINKGEIAEIKTQGNIGITSIQFKTSKKSLGPWIEVSKITTLPTTVKSLDKTTYQYLRINQKNIDNALDTNAQINFKVSQAWLTENNVGKDNLALYHYKNNQWTILGTSFDKEDNDYQYYISSSSSFSYFAIAQGSAPPLEIKPIVIPTESSAITGAAVAEPAKETSNIKQTITETSTPPAAEKSSGIPWWLWLLGLIIIFIIIIVIIWWLRGDNNGPSNYNNYSNNYNNYNNF
ncbi:PGF-pre-PGF domain-containing protein [Candidatus Woesearchaeota archaeon]|nr:PGF-pre-PGF domain-containing protein [Candidatus Woesearchaeota archaeon]